MPNAYHAGSPQRRALGAVPFPVFTIIPSCRCWDPTGAYNSLVSGRSVATYRCNVRALLAHRPAGLFLCRVTFPKILPNVDPRSAWKRRPQAGRREGAISPEWVATPGPGASALQAKAPGQICDRTTQGVEDSARRFTKGGNHMRVSHDSCPKFVPACLRFVLA